MWNIYPRVLLFFLFSLFYFTAMPILMLISVSCYPVLFTLGFAFWGFGRYAHCDAEALNFDRNV